MDVLGEFNLNGNLVRSGRFATMTEFPENPVVGTWAFIRKQLMVCLEVLDTPVWVPITPERDTYLFEQTHISKKWTILHQLDSKEISVQCFDVRNEVVVPDEVIVVDEFTVEVVFSNEVSGSAILMYGYEEGEHVDGKFKSPFTSLPIGAVVRYYRNEKLPENFLPLAGQTVTAEYFPELVKLFGGEDADSIVLDDARGVFVRNLDFGRGKDADRVEGSMQNASTNKHAHTATIHNKNLGTKTMSTKGNHKHDSYQRRDHGPSGNGYALLDSSNYDESFYPQGYTNTTGNHAHTIVLGSHNHSISVDSEGSEGRPRNMAFILVVKAK